MKKTIQTLLKYNNTDNFKIVSVNQILKDTGIKIEDLIKQIESLQNINSIDVKFFDEDDICYKVIKEVERIGENKNLALKKSTAYPLTVAQIVTLAFVGSMFANIILFLLMLLVF